MTKIINIEAARMFVASAIVRAVQDFRQLERRGWIVDGHFNKPVAKGRNTTSKGKYNQAKCVDYRHQHEVSALLKFFAPGGGMDQWIRAAHLEVSPSMIRKQLHIH